MSILEAVASSYNNASGLELAVLGLSWDMCLASEEVCKLDGQAIHVHISDCDGKVHGDLPPGQGVVKFAPYLQSIKDLKIDGAISIELEYSPDPKRIVEWVEEAYAETSRLMDQVGLRG